MEPVVSVEAEEELKLPLYWKAMRLPVRAELRKNISGSYILCFVQVAVGSICALMDLSRKSLSRSWHQSHARVRIFKCLIIMNLLVSLRVSILAVFGISRESAAT